MKTCIVTTQEDSLLNDWLKNIQPGKRAMMIKAVLRFAIENDIISKIPLNALNKKNPESPGGRRLTRLVEPDQPAGVGAKAGPSEQAGLPERAMVATETDSATSIRTILAPAEQAAPTTPVNELGTPRWKKDKSLWEGPYLEIGETLKAEIWDALSTEDRNRFIMAHVPIEMDDDKARCALVAISRKARDLDELEDLYGILISAGMI